MSGFDQLNLKNALLNVLEDRDFSTPTPIQEKAYPVILSGKNVVGISQTGTGKTLAYLLPLLHQLKYSDQHKPRVIILVPTRELVVQVVQEIEKLSTYITLRCLGIFGGVNINTQKKELALGSDVIVATPGRIYDLVVARAVQLQDIKTVVIDEVDIMLDLGFRFQLNNLFQLLPKKRQSIMFSATMTEEVDALIKDYFIAPVTIAIAISGTPLHNIEQESLMCPNFYTKLNAAQHYIETGNFEKVLVFAASKKKADLLFERWHSMFGNKLGVIHSNKSQNNRLGTIEGFHENRISILIATDIIARGLDVDDIDLVIGLNPPIYPENYMHRIGRTGRAEKKGKALLLYTEDELRHKTAIEQLMQTTIEEISMSAEVKISKELTAEERPVVQEIQLPKRKRAKPKGESFHEKKEKNKTENRVNLGAGQKRKLAKAKKYKKPITKSRKKR